MAATKTQKQATPNTAPKISLQEASRLGLTGGEPLNESNGKYDHDELASEFNAAVEQSAKAVKDTKAKAPVKPVVAGGRPRKVVNLESVVAEQAAKPNAQLIMTVDAAVVARVRQGQPLEDAISSVIAMYVPYIAQSAQEILDAKETNIQPFIWQYMKRAGTLSPRAIRLHIDAAAKPVAEATTAEPEEAPAAGEGDESIDSDDEANEASLGGDDGSNDDDDDEDIDLDNLSPEDFDDGAADDASPEDSDA